MAFKNATVVLASAVAASGTFTAAYPAGTTAGSYVGFGHLMVADGLQATFKQDLGGMSVSFGASEITVTYKGVTSIPAGSRVRLQLNQSGVDSGDATNLTGMKRMTFATPVIIDLGAPKATDDDAIAESQTVTGAGTAFVLNGVQSDLYGGVAVRLDVPRALSAGWTNTAILTITGKDEYGDVMIETTASGTTHTGKKAFAEITSIKTNATITSAKVGIIDVLGLPVFVEKLSQIKGEMKDRVLQAGTGGRTVYVQGIILEAAIDAATSLFLVSPVAGRIKSVTVQSQGTWTTGGAFTVEINTTAVDGLSVVVADGSAAGDVDTDTPTAGHASAVVAVGDDIEIVPASAMNASADAIVVVEIEATYALDGTFVAGVQTLPTGTTGDVRGTYDPATACDASLAFALEVVVPSPTYRGVDNYDG